MPAMFACVALLAGKFTSGTLRKFGDAWKRTGAHRSMDEEHSRGRRAKVLDVESTTPQQMFAGLRLWQWGIFEKSKGVNFVNYRD